jgi:hypothetical protein
VIRVRDLQIEFERKTYEVFTHDDPSFGSR